MLNKFWHLLNIHVAFFLAALWHDSKSPHQFFGLCFHALVLSQADVWPAVHVFGFFLWEHANVLVEHAGGYSQQAWKHAASWVNISQGHIVVWSQCPREGLGTEQPVSWTQHVIGTESDAMLVTTNNIYTDIKRLLRSSHQHYDRSSGRKMWERCWQTGGKGTSKLMLAGPNGCKQAYFLDSWRRICCDEGQQRKKKNVHQTVGHEPGGVKAGMLNSSTPAHWLGIQTVVKG